VSHYLSKYPPPYTAAHFNNSGTTRAFPDVSANGANYVVAVNGSFSLVYGTSASTPVFGAIVTLINEARLAVGKGPVGFINPVLYAHPEVLNDVTLGTNPGCGTVGFSAQPGWDPVTGLGTPNFPKMVALFLSLP
jgi:tripeptidyl-peptidase I